MKKLIFLLVLVLAVAAGIVYYKNWRGNFLRKKVPQLVFLKSDSLYRITYDTVYLDEIEGEIVIKNLQLKPDTTYKKTSDSTFPRQLLQVTVPEIVITGVQTNDAILNKEIVAGKIQLSSPQVTMFSNPQSALPQKNDSTATTDKIYKVLLRGLEKISVDSILITNADYHICRWPGGDTVFSGRNINAQLHQITISDSTSTDTSRVLFAKNARLAVKNILIRGKNNLYHYRFNNIQLRSDDRSFTVEKFHIIPLMNEAAHMRAAKWQTDRLDFDFARIRFKQVNVQELLNGNLIANELSIGNASFEIFRDKSYPKKNISKVGHYPHQQFLKVPVDVALKRVVIHSGYIHYKEKNPQTASSGMVAFSDIQATLHNVINRKSASKKNAVSTLKFNCRFLDKIPLSATLQFYLNHPQGKFTAAGTMKAVDATFFNQLSKPMALVEINSGMVNRLDFNLTCNNYSSNGTITLLYDDLKVKLLKMENPRSEYEIKKVASFLVNMTVLNSNPANNKPVRVVTVSRSRDIYRSMFNLIWKSIFEGVQKTVGLDGKIK
jgi:hypothetical protein